MSIQPLAEIETQVTLTQETQIAENYAEKVVDSLFNYLSSFQQDQNAQQAGMMVIP